MACRDVGPSRSLELAARAKLNLRLEVLGRRPDGYHDVLTLLHSIALADLVRVEVSEHDPLGPTDGAAGVGASGDVEVTCLPDRSLGGPANLAAQAARAYLDASAASAPGASRRRVRVSIEKRIPVGAGMGGGSADAAATLLALHALIGPAAGGPGRPNLTRLAAQLGSDVPFCLCGGAAWGSGRGDVLTWVRSEVRCAVVIAAPELVVRSGEAYGWWDLDTVVQGQARAAGQPPASRCPVAVESLEQLRPLTANGLRPVVARRVPLVEDLVRALIQRGALAAEMTGSGPAVFGLYETEGAAARAAAALRSAFPGVLVMLSAADPTRLDPRSLAPAAPRPGTAAARSRPGAREERLGGREN